MMTVNIQQLGKKAQACLANKADIPMSPLYHMGMATKFNASTNAKYMQDAIDYLTCKAKAGLAFSDDEKEFMKEIFEAFWWGGHYKGYKEAAQLADHYVNGDGNSQAKPLMINSEVYKTAKIVIATLSSMKQFILELKKNNKSYANIRCDNVQFRTKSYAKSLMRMNYKTEGKMKASGVLEAAQNNHRLHKTDGHFYLRAVSVPMPGKLIKTIWSVDSLYDFEPFNKKNYYTIIPLGNDNLILPDGLSEYLTKIGVAKAFWYRAEWIESWSQQ